MFFHKIISFEIIVNALLSTFYLNTKTCINIWKQFYFLPLSVSADKIFNKSTSSSSSCLHGMIDFIVPVRIIMTWTCKISLKWTLKFKILQLVQCIVETDNNDVCVRAVEIQMQMVHFRIAGVHCQISCSSGFHGIPNALVELVVA